jgi:hypothetical protein
VQCESRRTCPTVARESCHGAFVCQQSFLFVVFRFEYLKIAVMSSASRGVRCTAHDDGTVWMHLDVQIPSRLLNKSQVLMDAMVSGGDPSSTRDFTLAAPTEWLQAWVVYCCGDKQRLGRADTEELVHCLMVCFFHYLAACSALTSYIVCSCCSCVDCHSKARPDTFIQLLRPDYFDFDLLAACSVEVFSLQLRRKPWSKILFSMTSGRSGCRQLIFSQSRAT